MAGTGMAESIEHYDQLERLLAMNGVREGYNQFNAFLAVAEAQSCVRAALRCPTRPAAPVLRSGR